MSINNLSEKEEISLDGKLVKRAYKESKQIFGDWTPAASNPSFWFDFTDTSTITHTSNAVSEVKDKSGNGHHLTGSGITKPITNTRQINGLNVLDFDGINDYLNNTTYTRPANPVVRIVVVRFDALGNVHIINSDNTNGRVLFTTDSLNFSVFDSLNVESSVNPIVGDTYMYMGIFDGADSLLRLDGTELVSGDAGSSTATGITIGASFNKNRPLNGVIAEVIEMPYTFNNMMNVEGYLANKYNLKPNLPTDHPYKNSAPRIGKWSPKYLKSDVLNLWLDASDTSTITESGGLVSQWDDKSGNGYNISQSDNAKKPTVSNNEVIFDGLDDYLSVNSRLGLSANPDILIIMIIRPIAGVTDIIASIGSGSRNLMVGKSGEWGWFFSGGNEQYNNVTNGVETIAAFYRPSGGGFGSSKFYQNGTEQTVSSVANPTTSPTDTSEFFVMGTNGALGLFTSSAIKEFIITTDNSDKNRKNIEGYLADKYSLKTSLPTDHIYKVDYPQALEFNPLDVSPTAWWDFSDASTITDVANAVSQVDDKSGNGNNATQGVGANQPLTNTDTINGLNALSFDGLNSFMNFTNIDFLDKSLFFVVENVLNGSNDMLMSGTPNKQIRLSSNDNLSIVAGDNNWLANDGGGSVSSSSSITSSPTILCFEGGSTAKFFINGVQDVNTYNRFDTTPFLLEILGQINSGNYFEGKMGEIIITPILTPLKRQQMFKYLSNKWKLDLV